MNIIQGRVKVPRRTVVYGVHGIGKSTFAASAPKPIFVPTEDGLADVGADRFALCTTFGAVLESLRSIYEEKHSYQTVVIDSLDWLERLVWRDVCETEGVESIEKIGYGKGYVQALDGWRRVLDALTMLRDERGMGSVMIAHSAIVRFEDPESDGYDRYAPQLHKHAAALVTQWADEVLFATYRTFTKESEEKFGGKRTRAVGSGERILRTSERPAHVGKNRLGMPPEIPLAWAEYQKWIDGQPVEQDKPKKAAKVAAVKTETISAEAK